MVLAPQQLAQRLVHQEIIFKNPIYPHILEIKPNIIETKKKYPLKLEKKVPLANRKEKYLHFPKMRNRDHKGTSKNRCH